MLRYTRPVTDLRSRLSAISGSLSVITVDVESWKPTRGKIKFEGAWMRYKNTLPWALKGVDFEIPPREKVGVVGR
jgi:ABC-type multidrug transport system fused ATPase/permease subunit